MSHPAVSGISVVIPNYNGRYWLGEVIPPLLNALEKAALPSEIIVSDDRSTDDSVSFLQSTYPCVLVISNPDNLGFAPTINKGIFASRHSHILLLNSDVKLTPDFFGGLMRYFDKEDTFGVMTRIIGWDDDIIQDGGKYPFYHGLKIKTSGNYVPVEERPGQWLYSMYLSGACALVDREKIMLLQGFDEIFAPFYIEDYELSIRAWRFGWKCYYDHSTVCRHKESVTIKAKVKRDQIRQIYYRNKMYLQALHLPGILLPVWHIQLFFECLLNLLAFRFYYIRAVFQYLPRWPALYAKRKAFRTLGRQKGRELLSLKQAAKLVLDNLSQVGVKLLK
ncbi:MAG: glycosyltransferase family 2 protein [Bacteroidota bacterium]|nr:glycosyltransferase family 2 protein [Bacteroidota bacterium]